MKKIREATAGPDAGDAPVGVWDPLVRFVHWTLVVAFFVAYFTEDNFLLPHVWAGYTVGALVMLRILWGLVCRAATRTIQRLRLRSTRGGALPARPPRVSREALPRP